jgi:hypothetical protein
MVRPRKPGAFVPKEVGLTPKQIKYLVILVEKEGFGESLPDVVRNFVWNGINHLIEVGRLDEIK